MHSAQRLLIGFKSAEQVARSKFDRTPLGYRTSSSVYANGKKYDNKEALKLAQ